jgi:lipid-A-disaccharide synthase
MKSVMIIAGEASGDQHAALLVDAVHQKDPAVSFFGIGGEKMRAAGVETLVDAADMAVVGLIEVLAHRKVIFGALDKMRALLVERKPNLLILVDYPEFNLRLAKAAKEAGIKVLFYISPQVWAWRQKRVHTIRQRIDMMAVVFPFEVDFYQQHDVPVRYVGHPLVDEVKSSQPRQELLKEFSLQAERPIVGIFPGSRKSEIKRLLPILMEAAHQILTQQPEVQFVLPLASTINEATLGIQDHPIRPYIKIIPKRSYDVIEVCDAIMTVSGTVTLEIALMQKPMVIINKVAWLTYHIVRRMLKIEHIGLCNIVAGQRLVPELIQQQARPELIAEEIMRFLTDSDYYEKTADALKVVREKLGRVNATEQVADLTLEMLADA